MSFGSYLLTLFEIALAAVTIWAVFHEDVFVSFEERVLSHLRRRNFKVISGGNSVSKTYYPSQKNA